MAFKIIRERNNVIAGLATGMISFLNRIVICSDLDIVQLLQDSTVWLWPSAMMATTAMQLAIDASTQSDNAGIAEMSELPQDTN
jgi:Na+/H+-translocating membrane pyrophosphatase